MEMTFDQYIQNPMGIANSVISNREMYRNMYGIKLDTIMVREMGKINYQLYKGKNKYYAYIKVPSEVVEKFYYDVIIEFSPKKGAKPSKSLKDYNVRFYSNDPSFVFTFAHAFIKNKMFINEYADKMSKEAVKKKAVTKNPMDTVGYVKSLFFAYLIMKRFNLFEKVLYRDPYNEKHVKQLVMNADTKIALRTQAGQELSTKEKRAKASAARAARQKEIPEEVKTKSTKMSGNIKTTKITGGTNRRVKTTKITNRRK